MKYILIFIFGLIHTAMIPPGAPGPFGPGFPCMTIAKAFDNTGDGTVDKIEYSIESVCNKRLEDSIQKEKEKLEGKEL